MDTEKDKLMQRITFCQDQRRLAEQALVNWSKEFIVAVNKLATLDKSFNFNEFLKERISDA